MAAKIETSEDFTKFGAGEGFDSEIEWKGNVWVVSNAHVGFSLSGQYQEVSTWFVNRHSEKLS